MDNKFAVLVDALVERGWAVSPNILPADFVNSLAEEARTSWLEGEYRRAGVGQGGDFALRPEIRSDFITWLDPANLTSLQQVYWDFLEELRDYLNRQLFLGLRTFEGHFAVYPPGSFYQKHLDQFQATRHRIISCLLYFNQNWQPSDGGQLRIYEQDAAGAEVYTDVLPEFGTFVCFRSDNIYHEVLPARRERYSLTGWLRKDII